MDPNQMQQMQQTMTKQELKDTQVLNLNDVKQVAKAEMNLSGVYLVKPLHEF